MSGEYSFDWNTGGADEEDVQVNEEIFTAQLQTNRNKGGGRRAAANPDKKANNKVSLDSMPAVSSLETVKSLLAASRMGMSGFGTSSLSGLAGLRSSSKMDLPPLRTGFKSSDDLLPSSILKSNASNDNFDFDFDSSSGKGIKEASSNGKFEQDNNNNKVDKDDDLFTSDKENGAKEAKQSHSQTKRGTRLRKGVIDDEDENEHQVHKSTLQKDENAMDDLFNDDDDLFGAHEESPAHNLQKSTTDNSMNHPTDSDHHNSDSEFEREERRKSKKKRRNDDEDFIVADDYDSDMSCDSVRKKKEKDPRQLQREEERRQKQAERDRFMEEEQKRLDEEEQIRLLVKEKEKAEREEAEKRKLADIRRAQSLRQIRQVVSAENFEKTYLAPKLSFDLTGAQDDDDCGLIVSAPATIGNLRAQTKHMLDEAIRKKNAEKVLQTLKMAERRKEMLAKMRQEEAEENEESESAFSTMTTSTITTTQIRSVKDFSKILEASATYNVTMNRINKTTTESTLKTSFSHHLRDDSLFNDDVEEDQKEDEHEEEEEIVLIDKKPIHIDQQQQERDITTAATTIITETMATTITKAVLETCTQVIPDVATQVIPVGVVASATQVVPEVHTSLFNLATQIIPDVKATIIEATQIIPEATQIIPEATQIIPEVTQIIPEASQLVQEPVVLSKPRINDNNNDNDNDERVVIGSDSDDDDHKRISEPVNDNAERVILSKEDVVETKKQSTLDDSRNSEVEEEEEEDEEDEEEEEDSESESSDQSDSSDDDDEDDATEEVDADGLDSKTREKLKQKMAQIERMKRAEQDRRQQEFEDWRERREAELFAEVVKATEGSNSIFGKLDEKSLDAQRKHLVQQRLAKEIAEGPKLKKSNLTSLIDDQAGDESDDVIEPSQLLFGQSSFAKSKTKNKNQEDDLDDDDDAALDNDSDSEMDDFIASTKDQAMAELGLDGNNDLAFRAFQADLEKEDQELEERILNRKYKKNKNIRSMEMFEHLSLEQQLLFQNDDDEEENDEFISDEESDDDERDVLRKLARKQAALQREKIFNTEYIRRRLVELKIHMKKRNHQALGHHVSSFIIDEKESKLVAAQALEEARRVVANVVFNDELTPKAWFLQHAKEEFEKRKDRKKLNQTNNNNNNMTNQNQSNNNSSNNLKNQSNSSTGTRLVQGALSSRLVVLQPKSESLNNRQDPQNSIGKGPIKAVGNTIKPQHSIVRPRETALKPTLAAPTNKIAQTQHGYVAPVNRRR